MTFDFVVSEGSIGFQPVLFFYKKSLISIVTISIVMNSY